MKIDRGFHHSVEDRVTRMHDDKGNKPFKGAFLSRVLTGDGDSERVKVESLVGTKVTPFAYPFASRSAWIRGQPEATTTMVSIIGSDTNDIQAVGYFDPAKSNAAEQYRLVAAAARQQPTQSISTRILPYRPLLPGELDIAAKYAQIFLGKGDVQQARGGMSHWTLTSRGARLATPLFEVKGHAHQLMSQGELNDEIRYGTVRRARQQPQNTGDATATPTRPTLVVVDGVTNTRSATTPVFAKEYSVLLSWFGDPETLIDHRQGIVVENNGQLAQSRQTRKRLRARMRWFTVGGSETTAEIDEKGNTFFLTSDKASEGMIAAIPAGNLEIKVGGRDSLGSGAGKFTLQATNHIAMSADGQMKLSTEKDFAIKANGRGEIDISRGLVIKSSGVINIDAAPSNGITLGNRNNNKHPVLVAQPEYISTLNTLYSNLTGLAGTLSAYGGTAAIAWAAIGPVLMLLDPSGTVMSLCLNAGQAAGQIAAEAPKVNSAIGQHLPRLNQMPNGFMSSKVVAE